MKNNKIIGGIVSLVGFGLLTYFYGWKLSGIIVKVGDIIMNGFYDSRGSYFENSKIRIPISEPKPIDFGVAERVLKEENSIVKTTGYHYIKQHGLKDPLKVSKSTL